MPDPFCHVEIQVRDLERAETFYRDVFGWSFTKESAHYEWIQTGGPITAGLLQVKRSQPSGIWTFVEVADAAKTSEAVRAAGGKVVQEARDVPGHGRYALIEDPEENLIGIWEKSRD